MSLLLIALPAQATGAYDFATSHDGQSIAAHGSAAAALLPEGGRGVEVVAVVPAERLSWQQVDLPRGIGPGAPRLRPVLEGLLEDRLLDEPAALHFALAPDAQGGASTRVAVCDRAWLHAHLAALEAAGRPVSRIVPEQAPRDGPLRLLISGPADAPRLLASGTGVPGGVLALPLSSAALGLLPAAPEPDETPELLAEPATAALAEQHFQRPAHLLGSAQRLLHASRSTWDLAQLELARSGRARAAKRAGALWRDVAHAPQWRPLRWGLIGLVLVNLIGLNLLAWHTRADLAQRQRANHTLLTQTFPHVQVVIDAPVQMAREVDRLRQASGALSPRDLEPLLQALAQSGLSAQSPPSAIEFAPGELRLRGLPLENAPLEEANARLRPLGYHISANAADNAATLRWEAGP